MRRVLPLAMVGLVATAGMAHAGHHSNPDETTVLPTSKTLQSVLQSASTVNTVSTIFDRLTYLNTEVPTGMTGMSSGEGYFDGVNVWTTPYVTYAQDTNTATAYESNTTGAFLGADTKIGDNWTAGLMLGFDHTEVDSGVNGGGSDSFGITVAPYGRYKIDPNYSVDASIGYTNSASDNDRIDAGTRITSSNDVDRLFMSVGLNSSHWHDRWNFTGRLATSVSYDDSGAYAESNNNAIGEQSTSFGQVQLGGTVSYYFEHVRPWLSMTYAYDYDRKLPQVGAAQVKPDDDRDQIMLGYGLTLFNLGKVTADFNVKHTLFKAKYDNTNIGLTFSSKF